MEKSKSFLGEGKIEVTRSGG